MLGGKYALEQVLGIGGMAAVYVGVHRNGNRVAVKVLHLEISCDPGAVARFRREGYVANSIGHPGAVRVLDDDVDDDGSAYLVMELLEGETLHARARRLGGYLPPREVLALASDLCDVLAAAHERGVVHRDVKPENLFLTLERVLKVLDFGIARGGEGSGGMATLAGAALGTPAFMAPEQALGHSRDVDARSDVWSAGATMFALLSGQIVHQAATTSELLVAAATRPARSLADAAPGLPAPIVDLVDRALRFASDERWPSAAALRSAIEHAHLAAYGQRVDRSAVGPVVSAMAPSSSRAFAELVVAETKQVTLPTLSPVSTTGALDHAGEGALTAASERGISPAARSFGDAPGLTSRESAQTLPATDPPPAQLTVDERRPRSQPPPSAAPRTAEPLHTEPRGGRILGVVLALVAGAALIVARVRSPPETDTLPHVGESPCLADADCGLADWACGPEGRCVQQRRGCTESRACVASAGGRPSICRQSDGACVLLESEDCKVLAEPGDVGNDATIWIGAMFPLSGREASLFGSASRDSVELARRDFAEAVGCLPPAQPDGPRRPLAVVACDDVVDPRRVASHLVDDLRVPAIIGFHRSKEVADLAASHFNPHGVLALASNTAAMLRTIPHPQGQPRLVWRTTITTDMRVAPTAAFLSEVIEPALRATPGLLAPGEPIRVALPRVANATGLGEADDYVRTLRFNGKSVAENGESFRQVAFADYGDDKQQSDAVAGVVAELVHYLPHVVLSDMDEALVPELERRWPATARFRPRYLASGVESEAMVAFLRAHPELRTRLFNVDTLSSTAVLAKFVLRHNEVFSTKITAATATAAPYDAFYVAAYAATALGREPVTGPGLARAIARLRPPGEVVDVGPAGIYAALAALGVGKNIDLVGATTSLDFDPETGDAPADFAVFCVGPPRDGRPPELVESGLVFRARSARLEGKLSCP